MNTTNGRIAEESKKKIMCALLHVMEQYDYKEITVTQISQEAGLSRKTFYRLFTDKGSVLDLFFHDLLAECVSEIKGNDIHHYWEVVQWYFNYWESKKELLSLLKKNNLLSLLFDFSYQHSSIIFKSVRSDEIANTLSSQLPYLLAYAVGGMHSMLLKWAEMDMEISSSELISKLKFGFMSSEI